MTRPDTLGWWSRGETFFSDAAGRLTDNDLDGPSLLPEWNRRTVIAHVAGNADALHNLLTWARSGVETPMYATPHAREETIVAAAALAPQDLRILAQTASERLADAVLSLPESAWATPVRTAQGRTVPASEIPWMRCREVWVHAVDLHSDAGFSDVPEEILSALVEDVHQTWSRRGQTPEVQLVGPSKSWGTTGLLITAALPELTAHMTGRGTTAAIERQSPVALPSWL